MFGNAQSTMKKVAAFALGAAVILGSAACGTTDETQTAAKDSQNATSIVDSVKKDDKIAAMLPQKIAESGKLTVGMEMTYAPAEFVSYYKAGSMWVVKKGNPDKVDAKNLCGTKIAVQVGTTQEEDANKIKEQCAADGKAAVEVMPSKQQTDAATNVVTGKADVFYADSPVAGYAISQTDGQLEELGEVEGTIKQGIAIKKGDTQLAEAVQAAMQHLMDDGTYMKILKAWGVESGALDKAEINPKDLS